MTVKELAGAVGLFAGALIGGGSVVNWVDSRYMNAAERAELNARIYHVNGEIANLTSVKALYDARMELDGELSPADAARRDEIIAKIGLATTLSRSLQDRRTDLQ